MNKEVLEHFAINRDAYAVNRGFYFQYLCVLKKWIEKFLSGEKTNLFTEVDEDIKEVGDKLVFTQVKCYSGKLSLESKEIRKTIFNFFYIYLAEKEKATEIQFVFETNTSVSPKEKLLNAWITELPNISDNIFSLILKKVSEILVRELSKRHKEQQKKFTNNLLEKEAQVEKYNIFKSEINPVTVKNFVKTINWYFGDKAPEIAIYSMYSEIIELLKNEKFQGRPPIILLEVFLSEIYRCSQEKDKSKRVLNSQKIESILYLKDEELKPYINEKLITLLGVQFSDLWKQVEDIQKAQIEQGFKLQEINNVINEKAQSANLAKYLTSLPHLNIDEVFGRIEDVQELLVLIKKNKHIAIKGLGGMGKSTLANFFTHKFEKNYEHIIWISANDNLMKAFLDNEYLVESLGLNRDLKEDAVKRFTRILRILNDVSGNGLMVIDDFKSDADTLRKLKNLKSWQIIITTQAQLPDIVSFIIPKLSFEHAKQLYLKYVPLSQDSDEAFTKLFEEINYNILVLELAAKTISNSIDLNILAFVKYIREQQLDDVDLEIDIENNEDYETVRFFSQLQRIFNIAELNYEDQYDLGFFALLPSNGFQITELVEWYGKDFEKTNKVQFANLINKLHKIGWIERNGDDVFMHKMLKESILYKNRKRKNAFVEYFQQLSWLAKRLHEGISSEASKAIRFLKYGESILESIKEPYRFSVEQPLLIIENEVLTANNWLNLKDDLTTRWKDLIRRAESCLIFDVNSLGSMYNNYALELRRNGEVEKAIYFLEKGINTYEESQGQKIIVPLINLGNFYLEINDMEQFKNTFDKIMNIRKKYKIFDDVTISMQCNLLGIAFQNVEDNVTAIKYFNMAIKEHYLLPQNVRNDINVVIFRNNLAFNYLLNGEKENAKSEISKAIAEFYKLGIKKSTVLTQTLTTFVLILQETGNEMEANQVKEILRKMLEEE